MSVKIRLARGGRKNLPFYRIVAANINSPRDGKFLEKIGYFDPILPINNENRLKINIERAEYWISVGAIPTNRVANLLISLGVKGAEKYKPKFIAKKKGDGAKKKALEKMNKAKESKKEKKEIVEEIKTEEKKEEKAQ